MNSAFPYLLLLFGALGFVWSCEAVAALILRLCGL